MRGHTGGNGTEGCGMTQPLLRRGDGGQETVTGGAHGWQTRETGLEVTVSRDEGGPG